MKRRIFVIIGYLLFSQFYSCSSSDNSDPNAQSLRNNPNYYSSIGKPLKNTSAANIARLQADLKYLGYDPGPINGVYGAQTKRSIERFQKDHGIYTDGVAGPLTESSLRKAVYARSALQSNTPDNIKSRR